MPEISRVIEAIVMVNPPTMWEFELDEADEADKAATSNH
jgi:hypothetical protein